MKKIILAVADINPSRRANVEQLLQGEQDIKVLTNDGQYVDAPL